MSKLYTILYVLACIALTTLAVSCVSQEQLDAGHELADAILAASDPASPGGAIATQEEKDHIASLYERVQGAEGIDWSTVGAAVGATAIGAFPALRLLLPLIPNRVILGTQPDPEVRRAAGIET